MTYRSAWCEVDLVQFRQNIRTLKQVVGTQMLQVVKANAYGHGIVRMAQEAVAAGADMLGLATIGETEQLLKAGIDVPILMITPMDDEEIDFCVAHGVHFFVWRFDQFERAMLAAETHGHRPYLHVEIDAGMARSGVAMNKFESLLQSLTPAMRDSVVAYAAHFFSAAIEDLEPAYKSLSGFMKCAAIAKGMGLERMLHIANSTGALRIPEARLDMVRMGSAAYGIAPSKFAVMPEGVGWVMSLKANVTNVNSVEPGSGVSYAWEYVATEPHRIATIGLGYGDGIRRYPPCANSVLLSEVETLVLGRVCVDQFVVRVPDNAECNVGDTAVVIGRQGAAEITARDVSLRWGTNAYDVLMGLRNRIPRVYVG